MFKKSKDVIRKSSGLLIGHLTHLEREKDQYHARSRIPGEIQNIIQHSSILSSIASKAEIDEIKQIIEEGKIYGGFARARAIMYSEFLNHK